MGKIIISFMLCFLFATSLRAEAPELPEEMRVLLLELKSPPISEKQRAQLEEYEKRANQELSQVSKLDFFIVAKGLINKYFIDMALEQTSMRFKGTPKQALEYLSNELKTPTITPITKWLIKSIYRDLEQFLQSKEYLNRAASPISEKNRQKMNIISSLVAIIKQSGSEDFSSRIRPELFKVAEQVFNYGQYFIYFSPPAQPEMALGKVFSISPQSHAPQTIEQILAPVLPPQANQAASSADEWRPEESPLLLPKPVNDWDQDNDQTMKWIDPNYIAPNTLPHPVSDWEDDSSDGLKDEWGEATAPQAPGPEQTRPVDPEDDWVLR